jgi:hypothetical protein
MKTTMNTKVVRLILYFFSLISYISLIPLHPMAPPVVPTPGSIRTILSSSYEDHCLGLDSFPNGKCPRNCICEEKYWDVVCESIEDIVENYERSVSDGDNPPPIQPTRERLVEIATRAYWIERGEDMPIRNACTDLLLDWPLPRCMHSMLRNIDQILSDWKELLSEIELIGTS